MLHVTGIPAFQDNYLWLIDDGRHALIVDPGDAAPVLQRLQSRHLQLVAVLLTHHHADHIGGTETLLRHFDVPVYGPPDERIGSVSHVAREHDVVHVDALNFSFRVLDVPGHTATHIAYFHAADQQLDNALFCGDTLFAGGCGRLFEGTPEQMRQSLNKIAALPGDTAVYCAHEYTVANLRFALAVEPDNEALQTRMTDAESKRQQGLPTIPSRLHEELATNPFLRAHLPAVMQSAARQHGSPVTDVDLAFAVIREWKNHFRA